MKKVLIASASLIAMTGAANAQLAVSMGGSITASFGEVENNVSEVKTNPGATLPTTPATTIPAGATLGSVPLTTLAAIGGTTSGPSTGLVESTSVEVNFDIRGRNNGIVHTYGGDIDIESDGTDLKWTRSRIFAVTKFGGLTFGVDPAGNRSADTLSVGGSGVSSEPLGREYADQLAGGTGVGYGIELMGVSAGITRAIKGNTYSYSVGFDGETLNEVEYGVFARGYSNLKPQLSGKTFANKATGWQAGGNVGWNNISLAASTGADLGEDYAPINGFGAAAGGAFPITGNSSALDDVEREYWNIGVSYKINGISLSADYDQAEWTTAWANTDVNDTRAALSAGATSTHKESSWSVGAAYDLAPGLQLGASYAVMNENIGLDLDANPANAATDISGLLNGGLKMIDGTALKARVKLSF